MGTTFVRVQPAVDSPGFWMRDGILEVWLRFLALHVEDPNEPGTLATTIRDQWLLASRGLFGGWVPHNMSEAVATEEGAQIVREAVGSLLKSLKKAPATISTETLNLMGFSGSPFIHDFEVWRLKEVSQAFLDLLDGKITAGPSSQEFMPGCHEKPSA